MLITAICLNSCKKDISLDYNSIPPIPVIEGNLSNLGLLVKITNTVDLNKPIENNFIEGATVLLKSDDGIVEQLWDYGDGYYSLLYNFKAKPNVNYSLEVIIDNVSFKSESRMPELAIIDDVSFELKSFGNVPLVFCRLNFMDIGGEENYYQYIIWRNGEVFDWGVDTSKGSENERIYLDILCMNKDKADKNDPDDYDKIIFENDTIDVEVQCISRTVYDYLYSLSLGTMVGSNPIPNFTNGALGYFSAYSTNSKRLTFKWSEVVGYETN